MQCARCASAPAMDTIFALSSGQPPAAIAVLRVSGPRAGAALKALAGSTAATAPGGAPHFARCRRRAARPGAGAVVSGAGQRNRRGSGRIPPPWRAGGGRGARNRARRDCGLASGAEPGEFTRRAFANGRIDLAEAEGLADLLAAETELQRRAAVEMAGGAFSRQVDDWREQLLALSARVEAVLDFEDEGDVTTLSSRFS